MAQLVQLVLQLDHLNAHLLPLQRRHARRLLRAVGLLTCRRCLRGRDRVRLAQRVELRSRRDRARPSLVKAARHLFMRRPRLLGRHLRAVLQLAGLVPCLDGPRGRLLGRLGLLPKAFEGLLGRVERASQAEGFGAPLGGRVGRLDDFGVHPPRAQPELALEPLRLLPCRLTVRLCRLHLLRRALEPREQPRLALRARGRESLLVA